MNKICWLDLETTGSTLATSAILEIGIAITDDDGNIEHEANWLHTQPLTSLRVAQIDPVVLEMHAKSGLWQDLQKQYIDPLNPRFDILNQRAGGASLSDLNREIGIWVWNATGQPSDLIPLAGSGVSHFDRQFIRRDLPDLDRRLTYWAYDVGVVRRMLRLVGINSQTDDVKPTHRALDDVKAHIAEYQKQLVFLRTIHAPRVETGTKFEPLFPERVGTELQEGGAA